MSTGKTAIVTGASSGIGFEVCRQLAEKGWKVYGCSRRGTAPAGVTGIALDVTDEPAVQKAFAAAAEEAGGIDLLINNAGFGISGPVEFTAADDARRQMEVNFIGQFICAKAVLPYMREKKSGRIVCTSSVAAPIAIPYQAFYSAGKAAVNSLVCALRNEVKDFGISVCAVLPGDAATGFTAARSKSAGGEDVYTRCGSAVAAMERDEQGGMTPDYVAGKVVSTAEKKNPPPMTVIGGKYKLFMGLFKVLPSRFAYWIVGKMYS